jgi:hypothetical protein
MNRYDPEMLTFLLITIRNVVAIAVAGITTLGLFYFSRSWWSLGGMLILAAVSAARFVRD